MSKMNLIFSILAVMGFLSNGINGRCTTSYFDIKSCNVNCIEDLLKEFPEKEYNATFLKVTIEGRSCKPVALKTFGEKFPDLEHLQLSAPSCPFQDLNFEKSLSKLSVLDLKQNGIAKVDEIKLDIIANTKETHDALDGLRVDTLCCEHFWKVLKVPNMDAIRVNCSNIKTIVSGVDVHESKISADNSIRHIYAPTLISYEAITELAPKESHTVTNLNNLNTLELEYALPKASQKPVKLPKDFLYNLPNLAKFHITGLKSVELSKACQNLHANHTLHIKSKNTSPVFFHSCPEVFAFNSTNTDLSQSIEYSVEKLEDFNGSIFTKGDINVTSLRISNFPMNLKQQFNKNSSFMYLSYLEYDNQEQSYINFTTLKKFISRRALQKFKIRLNSCDEDFVDRMGQFIGEFNYVTNLEVICKALICPMHNGDNYLCKPLKDYEMNDYNYHTRNPEAECMSDQMQCSKIIKKGEVVPKKCKSEKEGSFECKVNCLEDFLNEFPENKYEKAEVLSITIDGDSCRKIALKDIGKKFPNLTHFQISATRCPFSNLDFPNQFFNLKQFEILNDGDLSDVADAKQPYVEYSGIQPEMIVLSVKNLCCAHFWKVLLVPELRTLDVRCTNIDIKVSKDVLKGISDDTDKRYVYAPNYRTYRVAGKIN